MRAEVAEAYARSHARYAQIGIYEEAVRSGYLAYHQDLERITAMGGDRPRDVLPIELLNSFDLLANARVEYVDAIVDYNARSSRCTSPSGSPRPIRSPTRCRSRASPRGTFHRVDARRQRPRPTARRRQARFPLHAMAHVGPRRTISSDCSFEEKGQVIELSESHNDEVSLRDAPGMPLVVVIGVSLTLGLR